MKFIARIASLIGIVGLFACGEPQPIHYTVRHCTSNIHCHADETCHVFERGQEYLPKRDGYCNQDR